VIVSTGNVSGTVKPRMLRDMLLPATGNVAGAVKPRMLRDMLLPATGNVAGAVKPRIDLDMELRTTGKFTSFNSFLVAAQHDVKIVIINIPKKKVGLF